ncbi:sarcosine oxidase, gamma subunit family protein [Oceanicola granulosus HTCC2516]|uniref:Sarcosine oxidase, gamma subunit family protein n=1 Tax=Oceanicola granulosus (strain ATCC BAA-861 / DSM 15982 / KCTC 12143 / HTCC2516) TaxID=314256 RepID=Q2CDB8_OCEGH|nr:sarcosine oxidase gamma subunit family protein [Oceanicola granulosus]EAR50672.1 sarcosine oxidase, gamma subunit family protein [Oceanicola granulosus HTCC2516]
MVKLTALGPFDGLLPREIGGVTLTALDLGPAFSVAPYRGRAQEVSEALEAALGLPLPAPNRATEAAGGARAVWTGPGQALVLAQWLPDLPGAAVSEQGDGLAALRAGGPAAETVLARLVPVDLRPRALEEGHTVRTLVGHMTASVTRTAQGLEIMVFRSMAATLVDELVEAAEGVAARG